MKALVFAALLAGCSSATSAVESVDAGSLAVVPDAGAEPTETKPDAGAEPEPAQPVPEDDAGGGDDCSKCESTFSGLSCYPSVSSEKWGSCWHPSDVGPCERYRPTTDEFEWLDPEQDFIYVEWRALEDTVEQYVCPDEMKVPGESVPVQYKLPEECFRGELNLWECPRIVE